MKWHSVMTWEGAPYPTRVAAEFEGDAMAALDLGDRLAEFIAVHEAGHAVVHLAGGADLMTVSLSQQVAIANYPDARRGQDALAFVAGTAAGERAGDRWLREQHLWTPVRAVAAEVTAWRDRELARQYTGVTFGSGPGPDYTLAHDAADAALDRHWHRVLAVADALIAHDGLTGAQVADIIDRLSPTARRIYEEINR